MLSSLTKLEAINTMLSVIGEAPVNTLTGSLPIDTTVALNIFNEVNRDVQSKGWHFNTDFDVVLSPDSVSQKIAIPGGMLRVDLAAENQGGIDLVVRGTYLYDRKDHTDQFSEDIKATIVYGLDFEDIPHAAKHYIMVRAARLLQDRVVGSVTHHQFTLQDEKDAWANIQEYEGWTADHSIFDNIDMFNVIRRGSPINHIG